MNKDTRTLIVLIISLVAMILVGLTSCNPVKQVLKSQEKTDQVVEGYLKKNPPKNDTAFMPGKLIIKDTTIRDSIPLPYPVNHRYTETRIIQEKIRDTIKVTDRSFIDAINRRLIKVEDDLAIVKAERDDWKAKAQQRLYLLLALGGAALAGGIFYVVKTFQPKITIGKA